MVQKEIYIHSFQKTGFLDYIAARVLINNQLHLQGAILASTAIEKYIKTILMYYLGDINKVKKIHLDNLDLMKHQLTQIDQDITKYIDSNFLSTVSKVYKLRYYDNIRDDISIGFFPNQFLGELDCFINIMENQILQNWYINKREILSDYKKLILERDSKLYDNNYILENRTKKDHMDKPDRPFCIYLKYPDLSIGEIHVDLKKDLKASFNYDGLITIINVNMRK